MTPHLEKETKMRTAISVVLVLAMVAMCGCQTSSSPRGGSVNKDEGFKVVVPTFATEVKQGEVQTITVTLDRDSYFKKNVKLAISTTKGISIEPTSVLIKSSDRPEAQIRVTVPRDAALGEYIVLVTGTPESGEPTSTAFTVKVVAP
jgi:uncharacterized membrane protein